MTPKEKAEELVIEMKIDYTVPYIIAKKCALIAVDLVIEYNDFHIEFLQEVKQEIENL